MPANWPARLAMRLAAQLAPKRCATSDSRLTMPGRSLPITVNTSDVVTVLPCGWDHPKIIAVSVAQLAVEVGRGAQPTMRQQCIAGDDAAFLPAQAGVEPLGVATRRVQNQQCLAALASKIFGSAQQCGAQSPVSCT